MSTVGKFDKSEVRIGEMESGLVESEHAEGAVIHYHPNPQSRYCLRPARGAAGTPTPRSPQARPVDQHVYTGWRRAAPRRLGGVAGAALTGTAGRRRRRRARWLWRRLLQAGPPASSHRSARAPPIRPSPISSAPAGPLPPPERQAPLHAPASPGRSSASSVRRPPPRTQHPPASRPPPPPSLGTLPNPAQLGPPPQSCPIPPPVPPPPQWAPTNSCSLSTQGHVSRVACRAQPYIFDCSLK